MTRITIKDHFSFLFFFSQISIFLSGYMAAVNIKFLTWEQDQQTPRQTRGKRRSSTRLYDYTRMNRPSRLDGSDTARCGGSNPGQFLARIRTSSPVGAHAWLSYGIWRVRVYQLPKRPPHIISRSQRHFFKCVIYILGLWPSKVFDTVDDRDYKGRQRNIFFAWLCSGKSYTVRAQC